MAIKYPSKRKPTIRRKRAGVKRRPAYKRLTRIRQRGDSGLQTSLVPAMRLTARSLVNRGPGCAFPKEFYTTLPYHQIVSLSLTTVPWQLHRFRMNSLTDPDFSTGGQQPRGFDELKQIYDSYHVFAVAVDVNFMTKDTTREAIVCGVAGTTSYQGLNSMNNYREFRENTQRYIKYTRIDDQRPVGNIRTKMLCRKVEGVDKDTYNNDTGIFQADIASNPSASPLLTVFAGTIDQGTMSAQVYCDVKLVFYAKFFTRRTLPAS